MGCKPNMNPFYPYPIPLLEINHPRLVPTRLFYNYPVLYSPISSFPLLARFSPISFLLPPLISLRIERKSAMAETCLKGGFVSPRSRVNKKGLYCSLFAPSSLQIKDPSHRHKGFSEGRLVFPARRIRPLKPFVLSSPVPKGFTIGPKSMRWWEQGLKPNMREIESTQDLVDSLRDAGERLVVVDFFSPSCPGCKTLHPKLCQFAEANPDVLFLQVNYEKHKSMCYSLHVHVLPFFWFFRGAQGRVCGFSCTNQTIKKFKDALAKHTPARCSLGPTKGLDELALLALAANKELNFSYTKKEGDETEVPTGIPSLVPRAPVSPMAIMEKGEKELVSTER